MNKDVWNIRVLQEQTLRVSFEKEVSEEKALEIFTDIDGEYHILDEYDPEILEVLHLD